MAALMVQLAHVSAQAPQAGPVFDVVSIKPTPPRQGTAGLNSSWNQRPDGSLTATNVAIGTLIARAYPPNIPRDLVGLPAWAVDRNARWDVSTTSPLTSATQEQWLAMLRAMLADRFKLIVHVEKREQPAYDLLLARSDGRLGSGVTPTNHDCARIQAERLAAEEAAAKTGTPPPRPQFPDLNSAPPPCMVRVLGARPPAVGDRLDGDTTMANLAQALDQFVMRRLVVDKTGLSGSYRMTMTFDQMASLKGPDVVPAPDAPPTIFTAIREQLGLKLEPSTALRDTLIVDRVERPTEN
jgi:uncharacterized protein (TIGR03435 family)